MPPGTGRRSSSTPYDSSLVAWRRCPTVHPGGTGWGDPSPGLPRGGSGGSRASSRPGRPGTTSGRLASRLEKLIGPEIRELIEREDFATLAGCLNDWQPADLADLVADLGHRDQALFLKLLSPALAASTFEHLDLPTQERLLGSLSAGDSAIILNDMAPDDRTAFLKEVPKALPGRLLDILDPEQGAVTRTLLRYKEGSLGRLMIPEYVAVKGEWTLQDVLD